MTEVTYIPKAGHKTQLISEFESSNIQTMADVWKWSVKKYREKNLLGTRDVLAEEDEVQPNGKMFKKLELGDYRWLTYEEADSMADNFGRGLRVLGMKPNNNLCLYADTRAEWLIAAQASFQQSLPVVTIYTNLGESGVIHGLSETQAEVVITSHELLPKFRSILAKKKDNVKTIVYMENPIKRTDVTGFRDDVRLISFWDVAIGYSHPNTLTDKSTMVKRGGKGDASVLKPTIMFCVPLILDRIYKGVTENIKKKGEFVSQLMEYCVKYKIACSKKGQVTPIIDRLLFRTIRLLVG